LYIQIAVPTPVRGLSTNPVIRGVDVGIVHPATVMELPSKSSEFHDSPQDTRRHKGDQIDKLKTKRSKKRKLSRTYKDISRRINRKYRKIMNRQDNFERETAAKITKDADMVALETLNLKAMTKRGGSYKKGLNREMHYSRIGALVTRIKNSCEKHGIKLIDVNARYTSQTCSLCGRMDRKSRITQSRFECTTCNYKTNADVNAAYNIAAKAAGMVVYRRKNGDGLNPSTREGSSDEKPFDFFRAPRKDMRDDYSCI
jgi:putative transposase